MASPDQGRQEQTLHGIYTKLGQVAGVMGAQAQRLDTISASMAMQGVSGSVPTFEGETKQCRDWINLIDKYVLLAGTPKEAKLVAFQTSTGVVLVGVIDRKFVLLFICMCFLCSCMCITVVNQ